MTVKRYVTYRVMNPEEIRDIVRDVVDLEFRGNVSQAARYAGLSQPTLYRLCTAPGTKIRDNVLRGLRKLVGKENEPILDEKIFSSHASEALHEYEEWLNQTAGGISRSDPVARAIYQRMQAETPDVISDIDNVFKARTFEPLRRRLAFIRVIEPFLSAVNSGGIERGFRELSTTDFQRFIRWGWNREKILLRRAADVARAQASG